MASSGTISLKIDFKLKPDRGREEALIAGNVNLKSSASLEAADLELRTIKYFVASPRFQPARSGGPVTVMGSVIAGGSLMNSITLYTLRGSIVPHTGTQHVGSVAGGTTGIGFLAIGA
jgi:hypothetical protein